MIRLLLSLTLTSLLAGTALAQAEKAQPPERYIPPALPFIVPVDEQVLALAFSPEGKKLVTAGARWTQPGQLKIWDTATGQELLAQRGFSGIRAIAWSPNGKTIASGDFGGVLRLRDADTGAVRAAVKGHSIGVNAVAYSFNGDRIVTAGLDKVIKLWNAADLEEKPKDFEGHDDMIFSAVFFKHGKAFVTSSKDRTAKIWDIATGKEKHTLRGHTEGIETAAISPDDKLVATASWDRTVRLWDADTGMEQAKLEGHENGVLAVAFSPDGKILASAGYDFTVRLWDVEKRKPLAILGKHQSAVWALAFSRDGLLASGSSDTTAKLWNVAEKKEIALFPTSDRKPIKTLVYSPTGMLVALAKDKTIQICDAKTGDLLRVLRGHADQVTSLAFLGSDDLLASGSADKSVKLWNPASGAIKQTLADRPAGVTALAYLTDGKLAVGCADGSVQWCDAASGKVLETLKPEAGPVHALAAAPDGRLAIAGDDPAIKIFNSAKKGGFGILRGHEGPVRALAFSAEGILASAGADGTVKIWEPDQPRERHTLKGHDGAVLALTFSPRGQRLISGGADGTIRMWDPDAGQPAGILRRHFGPVATLAMHPAGADFLSGGHDTLTFRWARAVSSFPDLPVLFRQDFAQPLDPVFLKFATPDTLNRHIREPQGLRVTPPHVVPRTPPCGVTTNFRLKGDFDVIASYELLQADMPRAGFPIGVSLYVTTDTPTQDAIMIARFNRTDGAFYTSSGRMTTPMGKKRVFPPSKLVAADLVAGQLRLIRQGKIVRFLVADEGAEGFQELRQVDLGNEDVLMVRLAVDPGNRDSPPVSARLRFMEVRGQKSDAVTAPVLAPPVAFTNRTYAKELYQDFRNKKPLIDELKLVGQDHDLFCQPEDGGLRITLPAQRADKQPVGVRLLVPLSGDFEITGSYELLSTESAAGAGSWNVGVSLNLSARSDFGSAFGKVGRFILPKRGPVFLVEYWNKEKAAPQIWRDQPAASRVGKLRMVREGSIMSYQAADGPGDEFREYYKGEFGAGEIAYVRFAATGHPVRVDVRLIDLRIRYGGAVEMAAPVAGDFVKAPAPQSSRTWLLAALLVGIALLLAFAGTCALWLFLGRGRRELPAPAVTTPATIAFTCPGCGKKLKAKAEFAGRRVKCVHCGKPAAVPSPAEAEDPPMV